MPATPGDQVVILGDRPELPVGSVVRVIATDEHPSVPGSYLLVIDGTFRAHLVCQYRDPNGTIWMLNDRSMEGVVDLPEGLLIPGDIVSLLAPLTIHKIGTFPLGTLLTVVYSTTDWTKVFVPRFGEHMVPTASVTLIHAVKEGPLPTRTRWDFIDED